MTAARDDDASFDTYARYAEVYDALFDDLREDVPFYAAMAKERCGPDGAILELGAGTGRVTAPLLDAGYRVTAIDASAAMLARAQSRLGDRRDRLRVVCADARTLRLDDRFQLAIAPYGMVAHLLGDDDRRAAFRAVFDHLAPGGSFVFDDRPAWLAGESDPTALHHARTRVEPATGLTVRLLSNCVDLDDPSLTVRHDFIDWLDARGRVSRRVVVRVVFRNVALDHELALLAEAGFGDVEVFGDFARRSFDRAEVARNERVVVACRRPK